MKFETIKKFRSDALALDASWSDSWVADKAYIIKRFHIDREDGAGISASVITIKIADRMLTKPDAPAKMFGPDCEVSPVLDVEFKKGEKLDFTLVNRDAANLRFNFYMEVWVP